MKSVPRQIVVAVIMAAPAMLQSTLSAARADRALIVGINRYPHYSDMDLSGPVNDARVMGAALQKHGFRVTTLTERQATRPAILQALQSLRGQIKPHERLVFYFSGHGARDARARTGLLAHDAVVEEREKNGHEKIVRAGAIPVAELHRAVCAIPARGRTIMLDAPFPLFRGTSFSTAQSTLQRTAQLTQTALRNSPGGGHKACYFLAGGINEDPGEDVFHGVSYGVFTYFLVKHLNGLAANGAQTNSQRGRRWESVVARVGADVTNYMEGRQHPRLSTPYLQAVVFDSLPPKNALKIARVESVIASGREPKVGISQPLESMRPEDFIKGRSIKIERKPEVITKPAGTWGEWSGFNAQRERLRVQMRPDKIDVAVGQEVAFEVSIAAPGYLVVLERGTSGKVNLVFPPEAKIEQAEVAATLLDQPLKLPEGDFAFAPDAPGLERIRAYWFAEKSAAEILLAHFADAPSLADASDLRRPQNIAIEGNKLFTADVLFEVVLPAP